jgi:hypothetical protein
VPYTDLLSWDTHLTVKTVESTKKLLFCIQTTNKKTLIGITNLNFSHLHRLLFFAK